jgi:hypothetical protein
MELAASVLPVVRALGRTAGRERRTRTYALKHRRITTALDLTNGNLRIAHRLSSLGVYRTFRL